MAGGSITRPGAQTLRVEDLVTDAWTGNIRVPHFQRGFRWRHGDVLKLFDSIDRGYPIGSLLLWIRPAPEADVRLGELEFPAPRLERALWVIDGQQRIASLANVLHEAGGGSRTFAVAYDLRAKKIVDAPSAETPTIVPLHVLFDLQKVLRWFDKYQDAREFTDVAYALTTRLRQYEVPTYQVAQDDERVLQDIFDRMNSYGKALKRAEVFEALNAGPESARDTTLTFELIAVHIDTDTGFGIIDDATVHNSLLARRAPNIMREMRNEFRDRNDIPEDASTRRSAIEFPGEDRDTAYRETEWALRRAVIFLQNTAEVPHISMVPYRHLLVVLTRVFAHFPEPDARNQRLLRRWYWRAALTGLQGFKGSATGAVQAFCSRVRPGRLTESIQGLLDLVSFRSAPDPDLERFRGNEANTKVALCAWWARGPHSLETGTRCSLSDLSACLRDDSTTASSAIHLIVPPSYIPERYRQWSANRLLMPDPQNPVREVWQSVVQRPLQITEQEHEVALLSHAITLEMADLLGSLGEGAVTDFLRARQERLASELHDFLERMCEWGYEDTPPLDDLLVPDPGATD